MIARILLTSWLVLATAVGWVHWPGPAGLGAFLVALLATVLRILLQH